MDKTQNRTQSTSGHSRINTTVTTSSQTKVWEGLKAPPCLPQAGKGGQLLSQFTVISLVMYIIPFVDDYLILYKNWKLF
ncbi:hypothetical protein EBU71_06790 [bacterium]|nr:hypothetical protein [Candidatus Elulimicrobium humile]